MAKKTKQEEDSLDVTEVEEAKAPPTPVEAVPPAPKVSLERWFLGKGTPAGHRRGMTAFVKQPHRPRTVAEWDQIFEKY